MAKGGAAQNGYDVRIKGYDRRERRNEDGGGRAAEVGHSERTGVVWGNTVMPAAHGASRRT